MKINVIGLGPGDIDDLTLEAVKFIKSDLPQYLRTENHLTVEYFKEKDIDYKSFDNIYEKNSEFENVYEEIVDILIEEAKKYGEINYYVPGHPLVAEKTVKLLLEREKDEIKINLISGLSFIEPILEAVEKDPIEGFQLVDGIDLKERNLDINQDTIITQVYSYLILSDIKLVLGEVYGDEYEVVAIKNAGTKLEEILKLPIYKLDRELEPNLLTSLYIPRVEEEKIYNIKDLMEIMEILRSDEGCPWDREQTHSSLRTHNLEEMYELINAIENEDIDNMVEELGDVLLQVLFHAEIGKEEGTFNWIDITSTLAKKLIYRHPHVFSNKEVAKSDEVVYNWDVLKYEDRNIHTINERLNDIKGLPSLLRSYKIQKEASKIGFDWEDITGPMEKIEEEYKEILEVIEKGEGISRKEEEIGDLLFAVVNLSRFLKVDPEIALNRTIEKFIYRISLMEKMAIERSKSLEDMDLEELDLLWEKAKRSPKK